MIISICHECEGGVRPKDYCLVSQGLPNDDKL